MSDYSAGMPSRWFMKLLSLNVFVQAAIIVTGGIVRVTASGLGCPTWPECVEGSITPTDSQTEAWHKYVEFGNRTLTGVLAVIALATAVAVWRSTTDRRLRVLGLSALAGTVGQAILGGITVLTGLNPYTVAAHFLLSILIVALCFELWWRFRYGVSRTDAATAWFSRILLGVCAVVISLGTLVTGSGPHSGDSNISHRMPLDPRVIAWIHADAVWLFLGLIVASFALVKFNKFPLELTKTLYVLSAVVLAQGALGYTQHFTGLPVLLVGLHVLGSVTVWVATLYVTHRMRSEAPTG